MEKASSSPPFRKWFLIRGWLSFRHSARSSNESEWRRRGWPIGNELSYSTCLALLPLRYADSSPIRTSGMEKGPHCSSTMNHFLPNTIFTFARRRFFVSSLVNIQLNLVQHGWRWRCAVVDASEKKLELLFSERRLEISSWSLFQWLVVCRISIVLSFETIFFFWREKDMFFFSWECDPHLINKNIGRNVYRALYFNY